MNSRSRDPAQRRSDFFRAVPEEPPRWLSPIPLTPGLNLDTTSIQIIPSTAPTPTKPRTLNTKELRTVASVDIAAEILAHQDFPRNERDQIRMLNQRVGSKTSWTMSIREMYLELTRIADDSTLEGLHSILEPVLDAIAPTHVSVDKHPSDDDEVIERLRPIIQGGKASHLYTDYPQVDTWIEGCVNRLYGKLHLHDDLRPATGLTLFKALVHLKVAYGDLLGGMTPLFNNNPSQHESSWSLANIVIPEIRHSMLAATLRRFQEAPQLEHAMPELYRLIDASQEPCDLRKLSLRSDFNELVAILEKFYESPWQLYSSGRAIADWDIFCKEVVPYLTQCSPMSPEEAHSANAEWFVPGQIALVEVAQVGTARNVCASFDSHTGVTSAAVALQPRDGDDVATEFRAPLGGLGLLRRLQFQLEDSVTVRLGPTGKIFSDYAYRFLPVRQDEQATHMSAAVTGFIERQKAKLLAVENRAPELLGIVNESDPTIVIIEGSRVFVLGTCVEKNKWRENFFSQESSEKPADLAKRCGLELDTPELWFARELSLESSSRGENVGESHEEVPHGVSVDRKLLRLALHRRGAMQYHDLVRSLATFNVIETTDGKGSHGSLKRIIEGTELRAGTWEELRSGSSLTHAYILEVLEKLRIPIADYAQSIMKD